MYVAHIVRVALCAHHTFLDMPVLPCMYYMILKVHRMSSWICTGSACNTPIHLQKCCLVWLAMLFPCSSSLVHSDKSKCEWWTGATHCEKQFMVQSHLCIALCHPCIVKAMHGAFAFVFAMLFCHCGMDGSWCICPFSQCSIGQGQLFLHANWEFVGCVLLCAWHCIVFVVLVCVNYFVECQWRRGGEEERNVA